MANIFKEAYPMNRDALLERQSGFMEFLARPINRYSEDRSQAAFRQERLTVETGFADQSHLTRHFKRLVLITLGQYIEGSRFHDASSCIF